MGFSCADDEYSKIHTWNSPHNDTEKSRPDRAFCDTWKLRNHYDDELAVVFIQYRWAIAILIQ
jgi:hypothetical protein